MTLYLQIYKNNEKKDDKAINMIQQGLIMKWQHEIYQVKDRFITNHLVD